MITVQIVDVRVGYVHTVKNDQEITHYYSTMATDATPKKDIMPPHVSSDTRGISQNFFQDFVCCFCGKDATLTHWQSRSLYCTEHHPDWQKMKERK